MAHWNIWTLLLDGLLFLINSLIMPLFGSQTDQIAAYNLASSIGTNAATVIEMIYLGFSVFNLTWPFIAFLSVVLLKTIQIIVSIYLFIKNLIPML